MTRPLEAAPAVDGTRARGFSTGKRVAISIQVVAALLAGVAAAVSPPPVGANPANPTTAEFISGIVFGLSSAMWLRSDARERGRSAAVWGVCAFVAPIPVVPIWLIVTRRGRCGPSLLGFVGIVAALVAASVVGLFVGSLVRA